jgi:nitrate reductase delta subunit
VTAGASSALQAAALCLEYPDDEWRVSHLPLLSRAAEALPALPLRRFVHHAATADADALARHYVDTFDLRRRCCPYLTYYTFGDTRDRGMALLEFTAAYRAAGFAVASDELPDHLAVACEFAAREPARGAELLQRNRAGVELLALALREAGSPYVDVVDTVRALLPQASERDLERAMDLARSGPPAEQVGLEPFAVDNTGAR